MRRKRWVVVGAAVGVLTLTGWVAAAVLDSGPDVTAAPLATAPSTDTTSPTGAVTSASPSPTATAQRVFPVRGQGSYAHTHHGYPASDILAPCGAAYAAPYSGVIHEVNRVDRYDPGLNDGVTRGGLSVSLLGDDDVRYYGSHFQDIEETIAPGVRVVAGQRVATVGRTGDAGACHVHFGLSPVCGAGDWFVRRGVIWPWPYLDSWRSGGNAEPAPEIRDWLASDGCPDRPQVES